MSYLKAEHWTSLPRKAKCEFFTLGIVLEPQLQLQVLQFQLVAMGDPISTWSVHSRLK